MIQLAGRDDLECLGQNCLSCMPQRGPTTLLVLRTSCKSALNYLLVPTTVLPYALYTDHRRVQGGFLRKRDTHANSKLVN